MHVLENEDDLGAVEPDKLSFHATNRLEHVEELAMLEIVHQDVEVAVVLGDPSHLTDHPVVHLGHVLDLVEQVLLLLRLQHLVLRDDLHSEDCPTVLLGSHRDLSLESCGHINDSVRVLCLWSQRPLLFERAHLSRSWLPSLAPVR